MSSEHAKKKWFSWDKWSEHEHGLFKLEFSLLCAVSVISWRNF